MSYFIEDHGAFVLVTFEGNLSAKVVRHSIEEVMSFKSEPLKNDIFDFRNASLDFSGYEVPNFIALLERLIPKKDRKKKLAIIVSSGLQKGILETVTDLMTRLPIETQIFLDKDSAISWVSD